MSTALIGDVLIGQTYLWPQPAHTLADFFDRPPWERPTPETGYTPPDVGGGTFSGSTGVGGGGSGGESAGGVGGSAGFDGGIGFYSQWEQGGGGANDGGIITINIDGSVTVVNITASRRTFYTIEVHDEDGDLITRVPGWIAGRLKDQLDRASELKFRIPFDAEGAADLVRPNTVWLRDRWGFVVNTFQIQRRRPVGTGGASYIEVECLSAIAQLGEELVFDYDAAATTVFDHVTALLGLQLKDAPIALGTIDDDIGEVSIPFSAVDTTIHNAILALQLALPQDLRGRIYVDPQRRLQWRTSVGDTTEQIITRQRNVIAIDAEVDYSAIINRIYMYGEGQDPDTRLTLIDAGQAAEYIQDATSVSTWGIQPFRKVDRRITRPATLLAVAQRILEEYSTPPVTVTVQLLDLAKADDAPAGWRDIYIGGRYRVQDTDLALDTSIEIVGIEIDLARPVPLRVDLANQTRDLSDLISRMIDGQNQPLRVLGDRYPAMGRNLTSNTPSTLRAGDTRWNSTDDRGEMHDGSNWREMGGGIPLYQAESAASLPSGVEAYALGFITAGVEEGAWYERNADNDGWQGRTIWHTS